jgi:hypothetical protein
VRGVLPLIEADWNGDGRGDRCWGDGSNLLRFRLGQGRLRVGRNRGVLPGTKPGLHSTLWPLEAATDDAEARGRMRAAS